MRRRVPFANKVGIIMAMCLSLLVVFAGGAFAASKVYDLTLGTTSPKSGMYPWLAAHATEVNKRAKDVRMTAIATPGACVECAKRIFRGELRIGWGGTAPVSYTHLRAHET